MMKAQQQQQQQQQLIRWSTIVLGIIVVEWLFFHIVAIDAFLVVVGGSRSLWTPTSVIAYQPSLSSFTLLSSSILPSDVEDDESNLSNPTTTTTTTTSTDSSGYPNYDTPPNTEMTTVTSLKCQLIELCATYDRGFGTSTTARQTIDTIVQQLQSYNTAKNVAADTLTTTTPHHNHHHHHNNNNNSTIFGKWRMIYTTAFDVLSLQTSPFFITGAIYQVYTNAPSGTTGSTTTTVTNIIDFIPRFQPLFPSSLLSSLLNIPPPNTLIRAKVQTRACIPKQPAPNRIGLIFDSVSIQPVELFGINIGTTSSLPPLSFDLPKLPTFGSSSTTSSSASSTPVATGYFDVTYLDDTLLIIQQNAPGGIFCLLRTDTIDP